MLDVLVVSLGSTSGLRAADEELCASLRRAGASVELVRTTPPREVRTLMLTDLAWARAARRSARERLRHAQARAVIYSTTTAALLWPRPGAVRFDATATGNRPGVHGLWQRPLERVRLSQAPLLLPWSSEGLEEAALVEKVAPVDKQAQSTVVLPMPVESSGAVGGERDIAAITYGANPAKKGLQRVLEAWQRVHRADEQLIVTGVTSAQLRQAGFPSAPAGVRFSGPLSPEEYRALLRRARVFVCAPRREDYGIAQLEALADGCQLITSPAPGPYVALGIARRLDARLVGEDIGGALRSALDNPLSGYAEHAREQLRPFGFSAADRVVAEEVLPRLLAGG
jgi:glycosyltransferase involved in cell wall biosynthesis